VSVQQPGVQTESQQGGTQALPYSENPPVRSSLPSQIIRSLKQIGWGTQMALQTRSLVIPRLLWLRWRTPARSGGIFRFPFGPVRYNDAASLLSLYLEIFLQHGYEVNGLNEAPFIIDCGSNIGLSALWFKQRYPKARLTAFEADPAIADILEENIRTHRLQAVEVVRAAVSECSGSVTFIPDGTVSGRVGEGPGVSVPAVRLSDHIAGQLVDLLKIDIEGSEYGVVRELCESGQIRQVKHIICEVHGNSEVQEQIAELWSHLSQAGFHLVVHEARIIPELPGPEEPTPFTGATCAKFLMWMYAWRPR